jgi:hypothetical protein
MSKAAVVGLVLLLVAGGAGATPEEDVARLEGEVAALRAEVEALRAEVAVLRAELAELRPPEGPRPGPPEPTDDTVPPPGPPEPTDETEPPPVPPDAPPPPGPPPSPQDPALAGTYTLDRAAFAEELEKDRLGRLRTILDGVPEADRGRYLAMVNEQAEGEAKEAMLKVVLRPDGTWTLEAGFKGLLTTAQGTCRLAGDSLFIHRTHVNGTPAPEDRCATWEDGRITLPPWLGQSVTLTLARQN